MLHFTVANQQAVAPGCMTCCCEKLSLQPGTTSKISVGYAPWAVPIGFLHCDPQFMLEEMESCPVPAGSNLSPQVAPEVQFSTGVGAHLDGNLGDFVSDPDGDPLTYKVLPLYAPKHGKLQLDPNGPFAYDPVPNFKGGERFYVSVTDGRNNPVIFEVLIAVGIDSGTMHPTPTITIGKPSVDQRYYQVQLSVTLSPAANPCEIWRLTVLQGALDCDCQCFTRTDCFDIGVAKC